MLSDRLAARYLDESAPSDVLALHPPYPVVDGVTHQPRLWTYEIAKRAIDVGACILLLIVAAPLMLSLMLLICYDSPGPAVFRQKRVGKDGKLFTMYKFRTMSVDAPRYSLKIRDGDPRITRIGAALRQTCLDELPQLVNVLKGEMSLVGPRPEQPFIVDAYQPWQTRRLSVAPGLSGWWQIHVRNGKPMHEDVQLDLFYIDHRSAYMDLYIVWRTAEIVARACMCKLAHRA